MFSSLFFILTAIVISPSEMRERPMRAGHGSQVKHLVSTEGSEYVLRHVPKSTEKSFHRELAIIRKVADLGYGPSLVYNDVAERAMMLDFVDHSTWPDYSVNARPYQQTMAALQKIHRVLPVPSPKGAEKSNSYVPFSLISAHLCSLIGRVDWLPDHLAVAITELKAIEQALLPWLKKHAVMCHGDLHKDNVLWTGSRVSLIDWTTACVGHPFYDVAKFSLGLEPESLQELLHGYLGHKPTAEEELHFAYMDLALLMVVVVNRFEHVANAQKGPLYTKQELEGYIEGKPLPSFLNINYADHSGKARQMGAICALQEFLSRVRDDSSRLRIALEQ